VRKMGGRCHLFAHNGHVPPGEPARSAWLKPVGDTDSELIFLDLLQRLEPYWKEGVPDLDVRTAIITSFAEEMRLRGAVNFLYSDGITLFAHGHRRTVPGEGITTDPGLHVLQQELALDAFSTVCDGLQCSGSATITMVATLPISDGDWRPLAAGEILRIENGQPV
jgi:predicted glutamine amidotransferase